MAKENDDATRHSTAHALLHRTLCWQSTLHYIERVACFTHYLAAAAADMRYVMEWTHRITFFFLVLSTGEHENNNRKEKEGSCIEKKADSGVPTVRGLVVAPVIRGRCGVYKRRVNSRSQAYCLSYNNRDRLTCTAT